VKVGEVTSERDDFYRCYGQTPTLKALFNEFAGKTDDDKPALVDYVADAFAVFPRGFGELPLRPRGN